MAKERITQLRVRGLRVISKPLTINLEGIQVLIGENGSGKSTILEALQILHAASEFNFMEQLYNYHGGQSALGQRETKILLGVLIEGDGPPLSYGLDLQLLSNSIVVSGENLIVQDPVAPKHIIARNRPGDAVITHHNGEATRKSTLETQLVLTSFGSQPPHPAFLRVLSALDRIRVLTPFDTTAQWIGRGSSRESPLRNSIVIQPAKELSQSGSNLANVFHMLKNDYSRSHWEETMDIVRLGLGDSVEDIGLNVDPSGGRIALKMKTHGQQDYIPSSTFSDGTLAYLAFVALYRVNPDRSLLAFDEPDLHLHPRLLVRVLGFFEEMSENNPVLLATHSTQLLDSLVEPSRSVLLCDLDSDGSTQLWHPDEEALKSWLESYRGLGDVIAAGHQNSVIPREPV